MADENKDNPEEKEDKSIDLPEKSEGNEEDKKVDDEPPTRQPKPKTEDKEANRLGYELRKRDDAIKKLTDKIAGLESQIGVSGDDDDDKHDDDVREKLSGLEEKLQRLESDKETEAAIQGVFEKNPDYKKFEGQIRKYAKNEAYRNVPIDFIADGIAKRHKEADAEADEKKSGGSTKRKAPGKKSAWDMSKDEFEQAQADVLMNRTN